jgi:mycoredoxin
VNHAAGAPVNHAAGAPVNHAAGAPVPAVTVYWRRGCPFCRSLRRGLRRAGLPTQEVDIWSDSEAAAFVRTHAGGDETVPTVAIGGTVFVNPSVQQVVALATDAGIPIGQVDGRWWQRARR